MGIGQKVKDCLSMYIVVWDLSIKINHCIATSLYMVATGQGKVRKFKVREFCAGSGKFGILRKVREIQENPLKFDFLMKRKELDIEKKEMEMAQKKLKLMNN